ncbi:hypothetical protein ACFPFV_09310 [Salinicoccus siamensis]
MSLLKAIEGMPKHEGDKFVSEVNRSYSHKAVKGGIDNHSCEAPLMIWFT